MLIDHVEQCFLLLLLPLRAVRLLISRSVGQSVLRKQPGAKLHLFRRDRATPTFPQSDANYEIIKMLQLT